MSISTFSPGQGNPRQGNPPLGNPALGNPAATRDARGTEILARDPLKTEAAEQERGRDVDAPGLSTPTTPRILQRVDDGSAERAGRQVAEDLEAGVDGFAVVFEGAPNAFGRGLPATSAALSAALRDVPLGQTHLRIDAHPQSRASVDWLVQLLVARKAPPERLDISFGIDPAAIFAGAGALRMSIEALTASMPQSLAHYFVLGVPGVLLEADGRVFHNAGATEAQELGIMLASAVGYLRMFEEARQPAIYAAAHIGFSISCEPDRAGSLVKLAALRQLWERILGNYGVPPMPMAIHAETSYRALTTDDADANVVRAVLGALGAIEGGASTISALPHDVAMRLPDEAARRRARSALSVLVREGGAAPLLSVDPNLSTQIAWLAEAAWDEMRLIDAEGGILRSLQDGRIQQRIVAARDDRITRIGRVPMAGEPVAGGRDENAEGAAFCARLEPVRWEEFAVAEAA